MYCKNAKRAWLRMCERTGFEQAPCFVEAIQQATLVYGNGLGEVIAGQRRTFRASTGGKSYDIESFQAAVRRCHHPRRDGGVRCHGHPAAGMLVKLSTINLVVKHLVRRQLDAFLV